MNKSETVASDGDRQERPVFVSYATADRKKALSVCKAVERRRVNCWISTRDVKPGENYQEAIVRSIRDARAMVLVFSESANNSDEIKKELSLASRYHVPLMALRIEDVEPSDAFAYELSTRQWIDAFDSWDKSIDSLVRRIGELPGSVGSTPSAVPTSLRSAGTHRRTEIVAGTAGVLLLLLVAGIAGWWWLRPAPAAAHGIMVRLSGFQRLSGDLPATMPEAVRDEIITAFGDEGVVGVSTAPVAAPGRAPAYALGGTIRRLGDQIRVITRLTNERSGATLWSDSFDYDSSEVSRIPRLIAVDAGNMVRCGLYGASTYAPTLPDPALADYMQYCQTAAVFLTDPAKGMDSARKAVAVVPDFSWGWSAVAFAAVQSLYSIDGQAQRAESRKLGLDAANTALKLDPTNSEALAQKAILIGGDWAGQEQLMKQAVAAKPLACGCEHAAYGAMLQDVGRFRDSAGQYRRATEMLALDANSQFNLADALIASGSRDQAKPHIDAAIDLSDDPSFADTVALTEAPETGDNADAIRALHNPKLQLSDAQRAAFLTAFQAVASHDANEKARAVRAITALPREQQNFIAAKLLALLGASQDALGTFANGMGSRYDWASLLWYPSMRAVLNEPGFPRVAQRLGLMRYWKTTHTKPDVCSDKNPPAFCLMI
ncbi:MAG TPA: TIR domain-containing protein [Sphingomicrobium sp.]